MTTQSTKLTSKLIRPNFRKDQSPVVDYGQGVYLIDESGKQYLDASSGAIVVNIGHGVKEIAEAAYEQAMKVSYVYRTFFSNDKVEQLAHRVLERSPGMDWAFFVNSGTEATEVAMRLAWQHWQEKGQHAKRRILSRKISYHGMTIGALSVSGSYERRHRFSAFLQEDASVSEAYCYRCPYALEPDSCGLRCADDLEVKIRQIGADQIAAFVAEPVVGASAGVLAPPDGYWQKIREICDTHDVLMIVDEVITGFGRTGEWFGMQNWDVEPDMMIVGKGLSAGYTPMSAVMTKDKVLRPIREGSGEGVVGHTYSGNPQSAAVALAVMDYLDEHNLVEESKRKGELLHSKLKELAKRHPIIGDVRGMGMLCGLEFVANRETKQCFDPSVGVTGRIVKLAFENGLLVYPCRAIVDVSTGDAIIIAPPFVTTEDQIDEIIEKLDLTLTQLVASL